jgi:hypothetical protein
MKVEYTNRYNDVQTFEVNKRGNIQWTANFEYSRYGYNDNPKDITMVDPSGGPYIPLEYNMGMFDKSLDGMIVTGFIPNESGYEITINNTKI